MELTGFKEDLKSIKNNKVKTELLQMEETRIRAAFANSKDQPEQVIYTN